MKCGDGYVEINIIGNNMAKKKQSLLSLFVIVGVIEVLLVILSGNFSKKIEIGFDEGRFVFRHKTVHFDLQERITEDFQIDEYVKEASIVHDKDVKDFSSFVSALKTHDDIIIQSLWILFTDEIQQLIKSDNVTSEAHNLSLITHDILRITKKESLFQLDYESNVRGYLQKHHAGTLQEFNDLVEKFKTESTLSERDNLRLNRLVLESVLPENILERQEIEPRIYGSYGLYSFFRSIFGENNAISAFKLLRILLILDLLLLLIAFLTKRLLLDRPSKPQLVFEMLYNVFEDFVRDTLGKENLKFTPYILTLFLFIWTCNMIGLIPIPGFMEPTRNLNVPLGLGFLAVSLVHITAIKYKGFWHHFSQYVNPVKNPMFILDAVGEISKLVSISFRLFGNILGGAIIMLVVSSLVKFILLPVGLYLFFGIFVGTIQAFVFTMLALTYIGVEISE